MGSYVKNNLSKGETIIYETKLHWINFFWSIIITLLTSGIGFLLAIPAFITYITSEFSITNKRLMIKVGWLSRKTLELNLTKIESANIDQSILGRILGYGSITIVGTGGTREKFNKINSPLLFRKAIMETQERLQEKSL